MKKICFALFFFAFAMLATAQTNSTDSTERRFKNLLELDASGLIFNLLSPKSGYLQPYTLSYKRWLGGQNMWRFGVAKAIVNEKVIVQSGPARTSQKTESLNIGFGVEHHLPISKRWDFFGGADMVYFYRKTSGNNSSGLRQVSNSNGVGISPLAGFSFQIVPRVSLSCEANYYFTFVKSDYTLFGKPKVRREERKMETYLYLPIALKLRIHF